MRLYLSTSVVLLLGCNKPAPLPPASVQRRDVVFALWEAPISLQNKPRQLILSVSSDGRLYRKLGPYVWEGQVAIDQISMAEARIDMAGFHQLQRDYVKADGPGIEVYVRKSGVLQRRVFDPSILDGESREDLRTLRETKRIIEELWPQELVRTSLAEESLGPGKIGIAGD